MIATLSFASQFLLSFLLMHSTFIMYCTFRKNCIIKFFCKCWSTRNWMQFVIFSTAPSIRNEMHEYSFNRLEKDIKSREALIGSTLLHRGSRSQEPISGHRAPKVRASARKNTFWRAFVRFNVLLTITRDPCKLEGRNFDRRWDIFS